MSAPSSASKNRPSSISVGLCPSGCTYLAVGHTVLHLHREEFGRLLAAMVEASEIHSLPVPWEEDPLTARPIEH